MGEAELGEHGAGGGEAEVLDEVLSQQPHRHRVEKERTLSGEADHASLRIELQQFLVIQIFGAHRRSLSFELKEKVIHFDWVRHEARTMGLLNWMKTHGVASVAWKLL
jgi:hypothetical protein